jgi:hypothetical protein
MGRRYLLSDRVQIVLGTGGGKVVTKHSERSSGASTSVPQDVGRMSAKMKGGGEVADYVARLDQERRLAGRILIPPANRD